MNKILIWLSGKKTTIATVISAFGYFPNWPWTNCSRCS